MGIAAILGDALRFGFSGTVPYVSAVILAGGVGSRMHSAGGETKQLRMLCDAPVVIHTLRAFDAASRVNEIVLVARDEETQQMQALLRQYGIKKVSKVVSGGETRQRSALEGFLAIAEKASLVAIHDAARCLVRPEDIDRVISAAYAYRAATAAAPVVDTVKAVTADGFIEKTLPRKDLFYATTPQVFRTELYRAAVYTAEKDGVEVTDDNMLLEYIGQAVKVVDCGPENFKITSETDLLRAEAVLRKRGCGDAT